MRFCGFPNARADVRTRLNAVVSVFLRQGVKFRRTLRTDGADYMSDVRLRLRCADLFIADVVSVLRYSDFIT